MVQKNSQNNAKPEDLVSFSVTSLGSGSKGNATLIKSTNTLLLIDCGFSCKELESRMTERNINPKDVTAILVTHEHGDHFKGVPAVSNKYDIPVWLNHGTSLHQAATKIKNIHIFNSHYSFEIGDILIHPIAVPHDSREASQFLFEFEHRKIAILTDLGHITPYISEQLQSCQILLLEFNHDYHMLMNSQYPQNLKLRVAGNLGHLSNQQATEFLTPQITKELKYLIAMHLSEENNSQQIVHNLIEQNFQNEKFEFLIAEQSSGFKWLVI